MNVQTSRSNSWPTVHSGSMSTAEIKARIESMYADRGALVPKGTGTKS
ncbi:MULTISPECIES: hypothetical protein [Rhodococcus]|nr:MULTISPECIES: hypothetical protein [Rhodococcus]MBQ9056501.1 hypothetical protein [Rhodococcus sp. (in: high G+C Gram-positive bacteria)]